MESQKLHGLCVKSKELLKNEYYPGGIPAETLGEKYKNKHEIFQQELPKILEKFQEILQILAKFGEEISR